MKIKNFWFYNLPLFILLLAIGLSPSVSVGTISSGKAIEVRAEDFLMIILGFFWLITFLVSGKNKIKEPPLLKPIFVWLSVGFFSLLVNWILGNIYLTRGFFYFLKELQYFFIYFYVFYHLKDIHTAKILVWILMMVGFINAGWVIFELIKGLKITYYYGPTPFIEPEGTFPGGGFFLLIFVFLLNLLLYYYLSLDVSFLKKVVFSVFIMSPAVGVISSGSRGCFVGLIVAFFLTFILYSFKKGALKSFATAVVILTIIGGFFFFLQPPVLERFLNTRNALENLNPEQSLSRPNIWIQQLNVAVEQPFLLFFGYGKSAILGGAGESHSQFVRNFVETGVIGSILFLLLIYIIARRSFRSFLSSRSSFSMGVSAGLFCCTLAMVAISITAEGFLVVKISEVYWFLVGITMASIFIDNKDSNLVNIR